MSSTRKPRIASCALLAAGMLLMAGGCAHQRSANRGPFQDVASRNKEQATESSTQPAPQVEPPIVARIPPRSTDASGTAPAPGPTALVPSTQHRMEVAPSSAAQARTPIVLINQGHGVLHRAWPVSVCYRPSGDSAAGPNYWPSLETAFQRPDWLNTFMEPLEFAYNTLLIPYRAVITPPWAPVVYSPVNRVGGEPR